MDIGEYVRKKRIDADLTAKEAASRAGITDTYIAYIEKGMRRPTFDVLVRVLDALNAPFDDFLEKTGHAKPKPGIKSAGRGLRLIPVVTLVTAGKWKEVSDSFEPGDGDDWVESDVKGENIFALRVSGDSMEPEFGEGELITVNPHIEAKPNDFVVVKNPEGEATFKQLKRYGDRWVLHPLNPKHLDIEVGPGEFRIIGKVVKKEKRY